MHKAGSKQHGFTIVELLVVIVVIGILAAITVVSYTGISQKAIVAMLQSDLGNSAQKLKLYRVEHDAYPQTLDGSNCPTGPADTNYCLKASSGNTLAYSSSSPYSSFSLVATNTNGTSYQITDGSGPVNVTTTPITAIAAIAGTTQVGQVLTAGALTPSGATATYQWQRATSSGGTYSDISSATSATYTLVSGDFGNYIKVVATGTGNYSGSVTSVATTAVSDPNWIVGRAGSVLVGKYVFYRDVATTDKYTNGNATGTATPQWKTTNTTCASPQCTTAGPVAETQSGYTGTMGLVADNAVDFALSTSPPTYPARDACKALGGRLPTIAELVEMYNYKSTYGNNFQSSYYWSSTDESSLYARIVGLSTGGIGSGTMNSTTNWYTRCVR